MNKKIFLIFLLINLNFVFSEIYKHTGQVEGLGLRNFYFDIDDEDRSLIASSDLVPDIIVNNKKSYNSLNQNKWLSKDDKCEIEFKQDSNKKYFEANFLSTETERAYLNYLKKLQ